MEMPDNEFDELFRSKLNGFEAEPSANVWTRINAGINANKRRKIFVPVLSIAASIIVLVAAGILFFPAKENTTGKRNIQNKVTKGAGTIIAAQKAIDDKKPAILGANQAVKQNKADAHVDIAEVARETKKAEDTSPNQPGETQLAVLKDAQLSLAPLNMKQHVVPDSGTVLAIKLPMKDSIPLVVRQPQPAIQSPAIANQDASAKTKHKIHSVGDLVNILVAKVDKRKDKFVEFTDTDGDQSTITGVNLGIVKIKKGE